MMKYSSFRAEIPLPENLSGKLTPSLVAVTEIGTEIGEPTVDLLGSI
jgi:hypothetical protein